MENGYKEINAEASAKKKDSGIYPHDSQAGSSSSLELCTTLLTGGMCWYHGQQGHVVFVTQHSSGAGSCGRRGLADGSWAEPCYA